MSNTSSRKSSRIQSILSAFESLSANGSGPTGQPGVPGGSSSNSPLPSPSSSSSSFGPGSGSSSPVPLHRKRIHDLEAENKELRLQMNRLQESQIRHSQTATKKCEKVEKQLVDMVNANEALLLQLKRQSLDLQLYRRALLILLNQLRPHPDFQSLLERLLQPSSSAVSSSSSSHHEDSRSKSGSSKETKKSARGEPEEKTKRKMSAESAPLISPRGPTTPRGITSSTTTGTGGEGDVSDENSYPEPESPTDYHHDGDVESECFVSANDDDYDFDKDSPYSLSLSPLDPQETPSSSSSSSPSTSRKISGSSLKRKDEKAFQRHPSIPHISTSSSVITSREFSEEEKRLVRALLWPKQLRTEEELQKKSGLTLPTALEEVGNLVAIGESLLDLLDLQSAANQLLSSERLRLQLQLSSLHKENAALSQSLAQKRTSSQVPPLSINTPTNLNLTNISSTNSSSSNPSYSLPASSPRSMSPKALSPRHQLSIATASASTPSSPRRHSQSPRASAVRSEPTSHPSTSSTSTSTSTTSSSQPTVSPTSSSTVVSSTSSAQIHPSQDTVSSSRSSSNKSRMKKVRQSNRSQTQLSHHLAETSIGDYNFSPHHHHSSSSSSAASSAGVTVVKGEEEGKKGKRSGKKHTGSVGKKRTKDEIEEEGGATTSGGSGVQVHRRRSTIGSLEDLSSFINETGESGDPSSSSSIIAQHHRRTQVPLPFSPPSPDLPL